MKLKFSENNCFFLLMPNRPFRTFTLFYQVLIIKHPIDKERIKFLSLRIILYYIVCIVEKSYETICIYKINYNVLQYGVQC